MSMYQVFLNCATGIALPSNSILPHPNAHEYSYSDIRAMATSLVNIGYSFPISVFQDGGRTYCLDGHLRLKAFDFLSHPQKNMAGIYDLPDRIPVVMVNCTLDESYDLIKQLGHYSTSENPWLTKYFVEQW